MTPKGERLSIRTCYYGARTRKLCPGGVDPGKVVQISPGGLPHIYGVGLGLDWWDQTYATLCSEGNEPSDF